MVNHWLGTVHDWFLPPTCLLCDRPGSAGRDLCAGCADELPFIAATCQVCALPLPQMGVCGQCLQSPPTYDVTRALFHYHEPVDQLIKGLKFNNRLHNARLLGELMAERFTAAGVSMPDAIVPVPLHPVRLRQRGFNQALELARPLARRLGVPLLPQLCQRVRDTAPQLGQDAKARRRNLKDAFAVSSLGNIKTVAIVDDVMTTGSTAELLAQTLKRAGAERVELWVCARADLPEPWKG